MSMSITFPQISKCPVSGKRSFPSEQEALDFEKRNREEYGRPQQYVYKCEDCPDVHLTSQPPGTGTIAQVNYATAGVPETSRGRKNIDTAEVLRLKEQGLTNQEIADRLDISGTSVSYHSKERRETRRPTYHLRAVGSRAG